MSISAASFCNQGKTTHPKFSKIYLRTRLFEQFDSALRHPICWITAPAGSGKTVSISSYLHKKELTALWYVVDQRDEDPAHFFLSLGNAARSHLPMDTLSLPLLTPEYVPCINVFARNFFEEIFRVLPSPSVIVIDNYQEVTATAALHDVLRSAGELAPEGVSLIVISRQEPPAVFARLRAYGDLSVIGWDDLRLTAPEAQGIANLRQNKTVPPDFIQLCFRRSQGWVAGFVLLLDYTEIKETKDASIRDTKTELIFDYFATEIFEQLPEKTQAILIQTAYVPTINQSLLTRLTEDSQAVSIIKDLYHNNFFVAERENQESIYEFHPLFREFLVNRANHVLDRDETARLQARTAHLLIEAGNQEDAVPLLCSLGNWQDLKNLILQLGPTLLLQGRHHTLAAWLNAVPKEILQNDSWFLYYCGCAQSPVNPRLARQQFEQAFALFNEQNDPIGLYLSWCSVIDSYVLEWCDFSALDYWIDAFSRLKSRYPVFPSSEVETRVHTVLLMSLLFAHPNHADLDIWVGSARHLLESRDGGMYDINLACNLMHYYHYTGDISSSASILKLLERRLAGLPEVPIASQILDVVRANFKWLTGNGADCLQIVHDGLKRANDSGVHSCDHFLYGQAVYGCLLMGNLIQARNFLETLRRFLRSDNFLDAAHYHFLHGMVDAQDQEWLQAKDHFTQALNFTKQAGSFYAETMSRIGLARSLFRLGEIQNAEQHLDVACEFGKRMHSRLIECEVLLTEAVGYFNIGDRKRALASLTSGLKLNRLCDKLVAAGWWGPAELSKLYLIALEEGIEVPYVQGIIRRTGMVPTDPEQAPNSWPWPIRIYTLGKFEIFFNDKIIQQTGKTQRKPLELLKALIAFGGQIVPEVKLCEAVWPDADGDSAHRDFSSALYRLRRLIGNDKALRIENTCLSLDRQLVWLDVWSLDSIVQRSHINAEQQSAWLSPFALYGGEFIPDEHANWVLAPREHLRSKYRRMILSFGQMLESEKKQSEAIDCYLQALEKDPLAEAIYSRLMHCYDYLGFQTEALVLYERYSQLLSGFGLIPGSELQKLKHRISISLIKT